MITVKYSGKTQDVNGMAFFPQETGAGALEMTQFSGEQESQHPRYSIIIESGQLLDTAEICLQELSLFSGVDYTIIASNQDDSEKLGFLDSEYKRDIQATINDYLWLLNSITNEEAREIIKQQITDLTDLQFKQLGGGV